MTRSHKKISWVLGGIVLILALINIVGFFFVRQGPADHFAAGTYAGAVSQVASTSITIIDAKGRTRVFVLTPATQIVSGKEIAQKLSVGTFVLISVDPEAVASTTATTIRLLSTKPSRPGKEQR